VNPQNFGISSEMNFSNTSSFGLSYQPNDDAILMMNTEDYVSKNRPRLNNEDIHTMMTIENQPPNINSLFQGAPGATSQRQYSSKDYGDQLARMQRQIDEMKEQYRQDVDSLS
jgi:hypothetical protein